VLYHLGIPRGIYRVVYIGLFQRCFQFISFYHLSVEYRSVFGRYFRSVYEFSFLGHPLEVLGRYVSGSLWCWRCVCGRVETESDGTRWRTGGEVKGKEVNGVDSQQFSVWLGTVHLVLLQSFSPDSHSKKASTRLNWQPRRYKWTRPFRWKTKSGFCACAITSRFHSTAEPEVGGEIWKLMGGLFSPRISWELRCVTTQKGSLFRNILISADETYAVFDCLKFQSFFFNLSFQIWNP